MRVWQRIKDIYKRVKDAVQNRYEAATWQWGERSWLFQSLQDARFDIDSTTRQELQRRHRYWVANSQLVQRIRNLFVQFSVGSCGLTITPNSSDEVWNQMRASAWEKWGRSPELGTKTSLPQLTIAWCGQLFDDGEVFVYKTTKKVLKNGRVVVVPAVQTIESHRVQNPPNQPEYQGRAIIDGIEVDLNGTPVAYWVKSSQFSYPQTGGLEAEFSRITADKMIHKFKIRRNGQLRGIPEGFSCMNILHDYEDLHKMEMQAAKLASSIGNIETNTTGEVDIAATRRAKMSITSQNQSGQAVTKSSDQFYKVTLGAQTIALKHGDNLSQFMIARPTVATQNYWDTLHTLICCGYNVPKLLVMPYSLQGTVTRADLDVCSGAFRFNFEILAELLREVYEWQLEWAIKYDLSMSGNPPDDYTECVIRPPRAANVDIGYTAKALELELQMGVKTIQDVYAEKQQDWRVQLRQIAEAEKYINQLAEEYGITPDRISTLSAETAIKADGETDSTSADGLKATEEEPANA